MRPTGIRWAFAIVCSGWTQIALLLLNASFQLQFDSQFQTLTGFPCYFHRDDSPTNRPWALLLPNLTSFLPRLLCPAVSAPFPSISNLFLFDSSSPYPSLSITSYSYLVFLEMAAEEPVTYKLEAAIPADRRGIRWTTARDLETFVYNITLSPGFVGQIVYVYNLTLVGREYIASGVLPDQQSFVIDGTTAILRLVRWDCQRATRHLINEIFRQPCAIPSGLPLRGRFLSDLSFRPVDESIKQPDRCYFPPHPVTPMALRDLWPSFVVETGVDGWMDMLRNDVRWWFQHSKGRTHTVMLLVIHPVLRDVYLESWQLCDMPRPTCVLQRSIHPGRVGGGYPIRFDTRRLMNLQLAECPVFTVEWEDLAACVNRIFAFT